MDPTFALALPGGALIFAVIGFGLHKLSMRQFNRKYPHLRRGVDVDPTPLEPVSATMASTEAPDEARIEVAVTANQNAPRPTTRVKDVFDTVVTMETVETLKRAGLVVSSVPPGTFGGQVRGHSNILPPRASPRSRRDEGATATPK